MAAQTVTTVPATSLSATVTVTPRVRAHLSEVRGIQGVAQGPGEVAGPSIAFALTVENGSSAPLQFTYLTVDVQDDAGTPATPLSGAPASTLRGTLAPGRTAHGTYVFRLPDRPKSPLSILLSYGQGQPTVQFHVTLP